MGTENLSQKPSGIKKNRGEFLDHLIVRGWKFRAYIEELSKGEDFVLAIEHESEENSIIRFDQSCHDSFHVDILGSSKKPFKSFPDVKDINQKIDCVFEFIIQDPEYFIEYKNLRITLDKNRLEDIKKILKDAIKNEEMGKRTTSYSIASNLLVMKEKEKTKIFVPTNTPEDWKAFLAKPDKHWKTGYSAKALAYCWQEANDFPESVKKVFKNSGINLFEKVDLLLAFPEYKVPLPGGATESQSDIFILAKGSGQLIAISIEGKVSEPFGPNVGEWKQQKNVQGKQERLSFLLNKLDLKSANIDNTCYQLFHRTASALIEAEKFCAKNALMLVHSFSQDNERFDDYCRFLSLFGLKGEVNSLMLAKNIRGIDLYLGWVKGEKEYLEK